MKTKKTKLSYFEKRAANNVWHAYNDTEKFQKELIELYHKANDEIMKELYELGKKAEKDGKLSRSEFYRGNHLKKLNRAYSATLRKLGEKVETEGEGVILKAGKGIYEASGEALGIPINYDHTAMRRLFQTEWHGSDFSKRVWKNMEKLKSNISTVVRDGIHKGRTTTEIALQLDKEMGKGLNNAARLVRTETMHHLNDAHLQAMKDRGVKKVKEVVTLDERTSDECAPHQGLIHDIDKAPTLPRHPNCRCTLVPYIDVDELARQFDEEEAAILARQHVERMAKVEADVTKDLKEIAGQVGGSMEGLEYRLKGVDSLQRKILTDAADKGITLGEADAAISDVLRYTIMQNEDQFTAGYFETVDKLSKLGYTEIRVKNTFFDGSQYKGVNTLLELNGETFELQYHTPKSLEVKEMNHKLYEERRLLDTKKDIKEIERLTAEMIRMSSEIPNPPDVERIK